MASADIRKLKPKVKYDAKRWKFNGVALAIPKSLDENYVKHVTYEADIEVFQDSDPLFIPLEIVRETCNQFKDNPDVQHVSFLKNKLERYEQGKDLRGLFVKNFLLEIIKLLWNFKRGYIPLRRMGIGLAPRQLTKFRKKKMLYNSR